jgi:ADP-ribose pyrophosphatase YjhB (NUDIX family)
MTKEVIVKKGKFTSYRKLINPEKGIDGYEFLHEDRCNGFIVSILPYRVVDNLEGRDSPYDFLLRHELTPCWDTDFNIYSSITGGVDYMHTAIQTAKKELEEEAGYIVEETDLVFLGSSYGTKSSDTIYLYFTVDLTNKEGYKAKGDGSYLESKATCLWVEDIGISEDPLTYVAYHKLRHSI